MPSHMTERKEKQKMLPLKLVRSLVLGEAINNPFLLTQQHPCDHYGNDHLAGDADDVLAYPKRRRRRRSKNNTGTDKITATKTPLLLFLPTKELITDTYRLATIARDMGMDLYPTPSLSHIIFSYPSPSSSSSSASTSSTASPSSPFPISWSSSSLSSTYLQNDAVALPFPSLSTASLTHLRSFVTLSKGLFKLAFISSNCSTSKTTTDSASNWNCCSVSLFSRLTGDRIDTMDGFSRSLAGMGWTLFKTKQNPSPDSGDRRVSGGNSVYLFRKVESNRVQAARVNVDGGSAGECRIRELRLPPLDFGNAPLRILQYILLMTDDIFYLA